MFGAGILADAPDLDLTVLTGSFGRLHLNGVPRSFANTIAIKEFSWNIGAQFTFDSGTILTGLAAIRIVAMLAGWTGHVLGSQSLARQHTFLVLLTPAETRAFAIALVALALKSIRAFGFLRRGMQMLSAFSRIKFVINRTFGIHNLPFPNDALANALLAVVDEFTLFIVILRTTCQMFGISVTETKTCQRQKQRKLKDERSHDVY